VDALYHDTITPIQAKPRWRIQDWERVDQEITADDPEHVDFFRNKYTGEIINYDPSLTKTAPEQRGVNSRNITLI
jgi:hypothetical protein